MAENYIEKDHTYDNAIRELKAIVFDISCKQAVNLLALDVEVSKEQDDTSKKQLQQQSKHYSELLNRTMKTAQELVTSVNELEKYQRSLASLDKQKVISNIVEFGDKKVEKTFQEDLKNATDHVQDLYQEISDNTDASELNKRVMTAVKQGPVTVEEKAIKDDNGLSIQFVDTTPVNEESTSDFSPSFSVIGNDVQEEVNHNILDNSKEEVNPLSEINENENILPGEESVQHSLNLVNEMEQNLQTQPKSKEIRTFIKTARQITKAILVTKEQYHRLAESKEAQTKIVKTKGLLNEEIFSNTNKELDRIFEKEQKKEEQLLSKGLLEPESIDKQGSIESMLEEASNLYKEGKLDEAQNLYSQISVMNKEGKSSSKSFVHTKK